MGFMDKAKERLNAAKKNSSIEKPIQENTIEPDYDLDALLGDNDSYPAENEENITQSTYNDPTDTTDNSNLDDYAFSIPSTEGQESYNKITDSNTNNTEETTLTYLETDPEKAQDILEMLDIPITFEIEEDVLFPEDLESLVFEMQMPKGYDVGQVNTFIAQVKISIIKFVQLLEARNDHISRLATIVDRLQADVQNMKFDAEIANGINVMPTKDNEELETEIIALKATIADLKDRYSDTVIRDKKTPQNKGLRDQLSALQVTHNKLLEDYEGIKAQLAEYEEERYNTADDPNANISSTNPFVVDDDALPVVKDEMLLENDDDALPPISDEDIDIPKYKTQALPNSDKIYSDDEDALPEIDENDFLNDNNDNSNIEWDIENSAGSQVLADLDDLKWGN